MTRNSVNLTLWPALKPQGSFGKALRGREGISLVELLIVISVIGILAVALGFSYQGWMGRYNVEKEIKNIYSDLMTARATAINRDRAYFADFPDATHYRVIGDTAALNDWTTDGDGQWDGDEDGALDPWHTVLPTYPKAVAYAITWTGGTIVFDGKGVVRPSATPLGGTICIFTDGDDADTDSDSNPDYDCIIIAQTRINIGRLTTQNTAGGLCNAANCVAK